MCKIERKATTTKKETLGSFFRQSNLFNALQNEKEREKSKMLSEKNEFFYLKTK